MKSTVASVIVFTALVTGHGLSASALTIPEDTPADTADLLLARWDFDNINTGSYDFTYLRKDEGYFQEACPLTIQVRDNYLDTTIDCHGIEIMTSPPPPTMIEVFDIIQDAIDQDVIAHLEVQYDHKYGVPSYINIFYVDGVSDNDLFIEISNFKIVPTYNVTTESARMKKARSLWKSRAGNKNYMFEFEEHCPWCQDLNFPWSVMVDNNMVTEVYDNNANTPKNLFLVDTIDEIFQKIDSALAEPAHMVGVSYDEKWGFPVHVYIDSMNTGDADYSVSIIYAFIYE